VKQIVILAVVMLAAMVPTVAAQGPVAVPNYTGETQFDTPTPEPLDLVSSSVDGDFTETWAQMTKSAEWSARCRHTSVVLSDGSIVLMGGDDGKYKNDVWRSTDRGATWTQMTANAGWAPRSSHTSVALPDDSIVLMGGLDSGTRYRDVWRSIDQGATWIQMTANAGWSGRELLASVALSDGSIILMGGDDGGSLFTSARKNDVWRSTDQGATWTRLTSNAGWKGRYASSVVTLSDDTIVLTGGVGSNWHNDVWHSTNQGTTWLQVTTNADWHKRAGHQAVALSDDSIILMGGNEADTHYNDVWRSTDQGATWTQITANVVWPPRTVLSSVVLPDDSIVLMGGYLDDDHYLNDVWLLSDLDNIPQQTHRLTAPYIHQVYDTPSGFNGESACSEASAVMVLAHHGRLTPEPVTCEEKWVYGSKDKSLDPPRVSVYGKHVCEEYTYGDTTFSKSFTDTTQLGRPVTGSGAWGWIEDAVNAGVERPRAIVDYLELHDCEAEFITAPSSGEAFIVIKENIDRNQPVIARTYLGGTTDHYVVIVGYSRDSNGTSYLVNDPYGVEPYDLNVLVQCLDQPVKYTYDQMRLGENSRGLIAVHPLSRIQPEKIEEKQKTTISWDEERSNTFADPLALSGDIDEIIAGVEDKNIANSYICLRFRASGDIENPSAIIKDETGTQILVSASNLKVIKADDNSVIVCWDGRNRQITINQANNPYYIYVIAKDKSGNTITSEAVRVWVGRPVLILHGLNSDADVVVNSELYKNLAKWHYVEAIEYNPHPEAWKNAFGNIREYALALNIEIARIKHGTGAKKVDIVAHSMGGLISRYRIENYKFGGNDVGKLIMMGTPNHGSLFAEIGIITRNPNSALNQMKPGHDFLRMLNSKNSADGNSHWYDVYLYNHGLGKQDEIAENTQYYVLAGAHTLTVRESMPLLKQIALPWDEQFDSKQELGDGVVPYYSAMIANPRAVTVDMHHMHTQMWEKSVYYNKVSELLDESDERVTTTSGAFIR
jgi:pimeloyl-ACP methyl ester carboxylesterase